MDPSRRCNGCIRTWDLLLTAAPFFTLGGSTSFKLSKALQAMGFRTGLFVSPHIACFRERMQVNGVLVDANEFVDVLREVFGACRELELPATEFEVAFLMAAVFFRRQSCEAVVLEVGLGGEHDATNAVRTSFSIICSVALDHTRILGSTVELICEKKAGIFKPDTPALIGPAVPLAPCLARASLVGAFLSTWAEASVRYADALAYFDVVVEEEGETDKLNTALALLGLCLLATRPPSDTFSVQPFVTKLNHMLLTSRDDALKAKLAEALNSRPPCRWEKHTVVVKDVPVEFVFDMGHNPAAIAALVRRTRAEYGHSSRPLRLVCGMARDKDVAACVASLATIFAESREVYFVKASYWRAMASADLWQLYFEAVPHAVRIERSQPSNGDEMSIATTIDSVVDDIAKDISSGILSVDAVPVVIVCGSGYIMPDAKAAIGIVEARDSFLS
eukprot:gene4141-2950_t